MQFPSWMTKDDWSKEICEMHLLDAKIRISNILHENFVSIGKDMDKLTLNELIGKQTLRTNIAMQILSICFELTEDLASTCFSYAKAIKEGTKNVPEYLRDFGDQKKKPDEAGSPTNFYNKASEDICYAAEMAGLDPVSDISGSVGHKQFFQRIRDFRKKYDDWHQGYKHGQRTLPMYGFPISAAKDAELSVQNVSFFIYRIPQNLQEKDGKVFVEADVLDMMKEEDALFKLINDIFAVWQGVKQRQFARVFPTPTATPVAQQP
jgi:hypothetical protein